MESEDDSLQAHRRALREMGLELRKVCQFFKGALRSQDFGMVIIISYIYIYIATKRVAFQSVEATLDQVLGLGLQSTIFCG